MIAMHTARTGEIDDARRALQEIRDQIDFSALKEHSGGIIYCHIDYVDSGVVAALCEALPFDVIGMTTMASADRNGYGICDLSLTVLTSNEVRFHAGMSGEITQGNYRDEARELFARIRAQAGEDPKLILTFIPNMQDVAGYEVVEAVDAACGGIPFFGSITNNNNTNFNFETVRTVCNGAHLRHSLAMMFLSGSVEPEFIVVSQPGQHIDGIRAIITKSDRSILREVNGQPLTEYLSYLGLDINGDNIMTLPLMLYYDGAAEPVALGLYTLFDDGSAQTGGPMPEGTPFTIGNLDEDTIITSAEDALDRIRVRGDGRATLIFSCISRYIMLSPDQEREIKLLHQSLGHEGNPFVMAYAGGEICPMPGPDGKPRNRFHNYSFCACVL